MGILRQPQASPGAAAHEPLRRTAEYLPLFRADRRPMQYDLFHIYTVDEPPCHGAQSAPLHRAAMPMNFRSAAASCRTCPNRNCCIWPPFHDIARPRRRSLGTGARMRGFCLHHACQLRLASGGMAGANHLVMSTPRSAATSRSAGGERVRQQGRHACVSISDLLTVATFAPPTRNCGTTERRAADRTVS